MLELTSLHADQTAMPSSAHLPATALFLSVFFVALPRPGSAQDTLQDLTDAVQSERYLRWAGGLYFWIRDSDLAAGAFERSWMILQCG